MCHKLKFLLDIYLTYIALSKEKKHNKQGELELNIMFLYQNSIITYNSYKLTHLSPQKSPLTSMESNPLKGF